LDQADVGGVAGGAEDAVFGQHQAGDALLKLARDIALVVDPYAGDGIAMTAGAQGRDLALDHMGMAGEAEIIVAADFDIAGARSSTLQGMGPLPEVDLPAHVIIVNAGPQKVRLFRTLNFSARLIYSLIDNFKQHCPPSLLMSF